MSSGEYLVEGATANRLGSAARVVPIAAVGQAQKEGKGLA